MQETRANNKINGRYVAICFGAVVFSWLLHEWAHWVAGTLLGNEMGMGFNKSFPVKGYYADPVHYPLTSAAGPLITIIEAGIVYMLMRRGNRQWLYPFLFTCFYMRLFAAGISVVNANDEARISTALGIGKYTLPAFVVLLLLALVYRISRQYGFNMKFQLLNLLMVVHFSAVLILADQFTHLRLL